MAQERDPLVRPRGDDRPHKRVELASRVVEVAVRLGLCVIESGIAETLEAGLPAVGALERVDLDAPDPDVGVRAPAAVDRLGTGAKSS